MPGPKTLGPLRFQDGVDPNDGDTVAWSASRQQWEPVAGTSVTVTDGPTIEDMTINGNGIAALGLYARTGDVRGIVNRVEITGCTTAGFQNENANHSWKFGRCYIHDNTGWGVIVQKLAQFTTF